ncbi:MAG: ROK family protein [Spirochaetales bacterium]|nr:ROK family protein [Spirochaetales bacterium]
MKPNSYGIIKSANKLLVLNTIKKSGPKTTEDLVYSTRLSRPTILSIIKELTKDGLICKSGFAESNVGRQPALFDLDTKTLFAIGIDFDFAPVRLAVSNLKGEIIYNREWRVEGDWDVPDIVNSVIKNIQESLMECNLESDSVIGIGLGLPAILKIQDNKAIRIDRIQGWEDIPINERITEATGLNVFSRNDAHLLGMVEVSYLNDDAKNILYVVHRAGIGMAVFIDGKLYEGNFGNSGYIGHTKIELNGKQCECGNTGCLELYCSKRSITDEFFKSKEAKEYDEIVSLASRGNKKAVSILREAGMALGYGIANAVKLFDATHVIIGDVGSEDNPLFQSAKSVILESTESFSIQTVQVSVGKLDKSSFGLGGCHFVLDEFFSEPKLKLQA